MSFIAIHRTSQASLVTDQPWLGADDWSRCESASQLLERLQALNASCAARVARAKAEGRLEGLQAGREEALRRGADTLIASWNAAARSAALEADDMREAVVDIAMQVVQQVAEHAPAHLLSMLVRQAVDEHMPMQPAVVRVNPRVAHVLRDRICPSEHLRLREDNELAEMACAFDTPARMAMAQVA
jgi:flagellar biosynthesis/type III secretory pathway protein FliH